MAKNDDSKSRGERLQLMLTAEEIEAVDTWRFDHRMPSRSAAVRALIKLGFEAGPAPDEAPPAANVERVPSSAVGILDTDRRVDAALTGDDDISVIVAGTDLMMAHATRSILDCAGRATPEPALTADDFRAIVRKARPRALVVVVHGPAVDRKALVDAVAEAALPTVICAEKNPVGGLPDALRDAPRISFVSAPEVLAKAVADLLADVQQKS